MQLVIGDHNYSSWSLRPWLALKQAGVAFEEVGVRLYAATRAARSSSIRPRARCLA